LDQGFHSINKLHRQLSVKDIATLLKNGSKKPPRNSQRGGAMYNLGGEYVKLAVVQYSGYR
jgi:hypothetical protein